jgi:hypothetical protein
MKKLFLILGVSLTALGCYPTQYTHVEKVDDGYILTKNQAGFFRVHGEVWKCVPQGEKDLVCTGLAEK